MTRLLTRIFLASALVISPLTFATAEEISTAAEDPVAGEAFIAQLAEDTLSVLNDATLTADERDVTFRNLLRDRFDLVYVGKFLLGRHRRSASKTELDTYNTVFPEYILNVYVRRLTEYGDEEFVVSGTQAAGKRDLYVRSQLIRPGAPGIALDWRIRKNDEGAFSIIDLKVEGVSMAITQRKEFESRIKQVGLAGLIDELKAGVRFDGEQDS